MSECVSDSFGRSGYSLYNWQGRRFHPKRPFLPSTKTGKNKGCRLIKQIANQNYRSQSVGIGTKADKKTKAMASELHLGDPNWKFFQVGYPVDTPTDRSFILEIRTGNFSKSVTLWTPLQTGASSWRFELEIFPSRLPCGHPYQHNVCNTVSTTQ